MRTIGVLDFPRKKKRTLLGCLLALGVLASVPGSACSAERGDLILRTPSSSPGAVIGTDPEAGTRVMQTPEPGEQEGYQGPRTIIVSPEVFPGRPGNRPPSQAPHPPRPPQPRPR